EGWTEADREIHNARLIGGEIGIPEAGVLQDLRRADRYELPYVAAARALAVEGITVDEKGAKAATEALLAIRRHQAASQPTVLVPTVMGTLGKPLRSKAEIATITVVEGGADHLAHFRDGFRAAEDESEAEGEVGRYTWDMLQEREYT